MADSYARARITLDDGRELVFRDVRRFGGLAVVPAGAYGSLPTLARLGPEPLSDDFDPDRFARDLAATRAPVKPYLLSQRPVAGVGNIYADEALWQSRIHPASRRVGPGGPWPSTAPSAGSWPTRSTARAPPSATTAWSTASPAATPTS